MTPAPETESALEALDNLKKQLHGSFHADLDIIRKAISGVDGLVKAMEFYADQDNWDKGVVRPPSGQYQKWMMAACDKGNRASEALAKFRDKT